VIGIIPAAQLQKSLTPYADTAVIIYGSSARYWVSAGIAIAAFGSLNGWTLLQGQVPYAISKDQLFPPIFSRTNKKGVPYMGIIISSIMVSLFMAMNYTKGLVTQFKFLLLLSLLSVLIPYLLSAAAYLVIRVRKSPKAGGWAGAIALAMLAFAYALWAIAGAGQEAVYYGFLLLMAGIPFYVWAAFTKNAN
jgi:APA family basic amino acid/polyamine antiporter